MKSDMIENGVDQNKIYVSGIPVSDKFQKTFNKEEICQEFDLNPNEQVVLFFAGRRIWIRKQNNHHGFKIINTTIFQTPSHCHFREKPKNESKI